MKPRRIAIEVAGNDTSKSSTSRPSNGIPFKSVKLPVRGVARARVVNLKNKGGKYGTTRTHTVEQWVP
jgi:hypothetical protein